jgi:hypothetical protein
MNDRRPSISEMSQPGLPPIDAQQPAYVLPAANQANPQGEGQPVAGFDDFDAVFPQAEVNANAIVPVPAIVIDVAHDQSFADMLRMVELEEKLTADMLSEKKTDNVRGLFLSSLGIFMALVGLFHTVSIKTQDGSFDWSGQEANENNKYPSILFGLLNAALATLILTRIYMGAHKVKYVLDTDELIELDHFTDLNGSTSSIKSAIALNDQFNNQSIRAHGGLETLYFSSINKALYKALNPGTTATLMPLALGTVFAVGAILQFNENGPTNQFWTLVFATAAQLDAASLAFFLKHSLRKPAYKYLNQNEQKLIIKITRDSEIIHKDSIKAMFEFKRTLAAPLTAGARRGITLFHTQHLQQQQAVVRAAGEVEMQLRRA